MTKKKRPQGPYHVGYGKPPEHRRFQPGQSGNKKGRPKGSRNLKTLLEEELNATVVITENGRERRISKAEALIIQCVNGAIKGNTRQADLIFKSSNVYDPVEPPEIDPSEAFTEAEWEALLATRPGGSKTSRKRQGRNRPRQKQETKKR